MIIAEEYDKEGQYWRLWEFPHIYHHAFFWEVIRRLNGKPGGEAVWVRNDYWEGPQLNPPEFRQEKYAENENDFTHRDVRIEFYDRGDAHGYAEGKAVGKGIRTKQRKGKGKAGKGKGSHAMHKKSTRNQGDVNE